MKEDKVYIPEIKEFACTCSVLCREMCCQISENSMRKPLKKKDDQSSEKGGFVTRKVEKYIA